MDGLKEFISGLKKDASLTTENMTVEELMALANKPFESLTVMDKVRLTGPLNRYNRENQQEFGRMTFAEGMAPEAYKAAQIQMLREAGLIP